MDGELPPLIVSAGGIPYNGAHLEHWRTRAETAERRLAELRTAAQAFADKMPKGHDAHHYFAWPELCALRAALRSASPEV